MSKLAKKYGLIFILILALFLRIWRLDLVPVSLFGDELDVGYQAYSVLKTGNDYSGNFLPIHFRSLTEWRTPLYIYSAVPTVALFGISPFGVRLPATIFGVLGIWAFYLLVRKMTGNNLISLLSAFLLSISPWHLQYSRAGFEVTEMLFFFTIGLYALLKGFKNYKWLFLSVFCLGLTPWIYSTAKLFLPLTIIAILVIWWKELKLIPGKYLLWTAVIFIITVGPFAWNTIYGGGTERIGGISIFNDQTVTGQMGFDRAEDMKVRNNGQTVALVDRLFHNKVTAHVAIFSSNYLQSFSTEFLFTKGDYLNLRQSSGIEFYKVEFAFLILGLLYLIIFRLDRKIKTFLFFWLLASPIPSALTQGGGNHATRLILMLPVLIMIIALGIYYSYERINKNLKFLFVVVVSFGLFLSFIFYQHDYWVHYPFRSERWWQAGFEEMVKSAIGSSKNYDKVIISSANEPALKFFLGWSAYPPDRFQKEYKLFISTQNPDSTLKLGKYEFPPVGRGVGLYEIGSQLSHGSLYVATEKEVVVDLNKEPKRLPKDIKLVQTVNYPSGEPAFYLFTKP